MNGTIMLERWLALVVLAFLVPLVSEATAQKLEPPKPVKEVSTLDLPKSVKYQEARGKATLAKAPKLGFAMDVGETIVTGNWDVKARLTAFEDGNLAFVTTDNVPGNLAFRLPEGLAFKVKPGTMLHIVRHLVGFEASLGHEIAVTSKDGLVVASGRLFGDSALGVKLLEGWGLRQGQETGQVETTKFESYHQVSVDLVPPEGAPAKVDVGVPADMTVAGKKVKVLVRESVRVVPAKGMEGLAEGRGFILEYVVVGFAD